MCIVKLLGCRGNIRRNYYTQSSNGKDKLPLSFFRIQVKNENKITKYGLLSAFQFTVVSEYILNWLRISDISLFFQKSTEEYIQYVWNYILDDVKQVVFVYFVIVLDSHKYKLIHLYMYLHSAIHSKEILYFMNEH